VQSYRAKKAVELEPKVSQFQDTLGWVYRARGELDKAAEVLQKAAKIEPQQAVIWYHLGIIQAERKKTKDAEAALRQALQIQQNFPESEDARKRLAELAKKP
jgi:Flp pilus assembly protein TadD